MSFIRSGSLLLADAADREVSLDEEETLSPAVTKLRIALDRYEAAVLRRPVSVDRRSA